MDSPICLSGTEQQYRAAANHIDSHRASMQVPNTLCPRPMSLQDREHDNVAVIPMHGLKVVAAAVAHAMEATRGRRELYDRYDGNPDSSESMHDVGVSGRSRVAEAKAAAEARGEYTFAKMDHLGIQARGLPSESLRSWTSDLRSADTRAYSR